MIRGTGTNTQTGKTTVFIGISKGNMDKLLEEKPIHIVGDEMGITLDIVIFGGKDEDDLARSVVEAYGKPLSIHDQRQRKEGPTEAQNSPAQGHEPLSGHPPAQSGTKPLYEALMAPCEEASDTDEPPPPRMGPIKEGSHLLGEQCPACDQPFLLGQYVTLVPLGPGADPDSRQAAREGRLHNAVAIPAHYACVTGEE